MREHFFEKENREKCGDDRNVFRDIFHLQSNMDIGFIDIYKNDNYFVII